MREPTMVQHYKNLVYQLDKLPADEKRHLLRKFCREDLFFLLYVGCGRIDMGKQWLVDRCKEVQKSPNEHLDLWAREHYKSTIITFGKTLQDILASHGDDPLDEWNGSEPTFGIFSCTRPIAKGFLRQIKRELEGNVFLRNLFPDVIWDNCHKEAPKWSEDDGLVLKRKSNPKESTIEAWGLVDGQPTSKHFDVCIYDDAVTVDNVRSPNMIAKTTEAWELSINLGSEGGKRRYIGTRYHFNDTYRAIMSRGSASPRIYTATIDGLPEGEPVLLARDSLVKKRRDMGPYTFACFVEGTKILTADWQQIDIQQIDVGDEVVGYEFKEGEKTRLVSTRVVAINSRMAEVVELEFASGNKVICTPDHKFYTGRRSVDGKGASLHRTYAPVGFGKQFVDGAIPVYNFNDLESYSCSQYNAAWLAGFFDGEGSVSGNTITFTQSHQHNPLVCERLEEVLEGLGFNYGVYEREPHTTSCNHKGSRIYYILGGREEHIRFLNICKPARSHKIIDLLYKNGTRNFGKVNRDKLVKVTPLGEREVFNIQTITGNYIANGYATKNCQMLQNPIADSTKSFSRDWLRWHGGSDGSNLNRYILVDPAGSQKKSSDYTAMVVIGLGADENYYILDMVRDRLNLLDRVDALFRLHKKWKPIKVGYEKYGIQADNEHIKDKQRKENYHFDVVELGGRLAKSERIERIIPSLSEGRWYLPDSIFRTNYEGRVQDLVDIFINEEYMAYPVPVHDDVLDCVGRIFDEELNLIWPRIENEEQYERYSGTRQRSASAWAV